MTGVYLALLILSGGIELGVALALCAIAPRLRQRVRSPDPAMRTRAPFGLADLLTALLMFVPLYTLKLFVLLTVGRSLFYGVSVVYVSVFVVAPLLGLVALSCGLKGTATRSVGWIAVATLALPPIGVYATFVEPNTLVVERVEVPVPAKHLAAPLRVAVLADIQSRRVKPHHVEAIAAAMAFEPHLILLPGDLIQAHSDEDYDQALPEFQELLRPLAAPLGAYFVPGNTDHLQRVGRAFDGTNVHMLANETVELQHAGRSLLIGGTDFYPHAPSVRSFARQFEQRTGSELRILLTHYPDVALHLASPTRVDLVVAGHTHGIWTCPPCV